MKIIWKIRLSLAFCWLSGAMMIMAGDTATTNATPSRVGVYDSRAVAYAWFWSDAHQRELKEQMQTARAARAAGQTNRWQDLNAVLRQQQDEMHREVFSTAPATNALADLRERLPEIEKQAGVAALV